MTRPVSRSVRITGRVQGVAFRAWTQSTARDLGLSGWVRNTDDGAVEALIQGPKDRVDAMLTAFHEGPGAAEVTQVDSDGADDTPHFDGFEIRS